jgi:hypothetical protein
MTYRVYQPPRDPLLRRILKGSYAEMKALRDSRGVPPRRAESIAIIHHHILQALPNAKPDEVDALMDKVVKWFRDCVTFGQPVTAAEAEKIIAQQNQRQGNS